MPVKNRSDKPNLKNSSLKLSKSGEKVENFKSTEIVLSSDDDDDETDHDSSSAHSDEGETVKNEFKIKLDNYADPRPQVKPTVNKFNFSQTPAELVLASNGNHTGRLEKKNLNSSESESSDRDNEIDDDESNDSDQSGTQFEAEVDSEDAESEDTNRKKKSLVLQNKSTQELEERCKPPPGFEPATINISPSSNLANLISPSSLHGKQIWHISAPSSVPITSIQEVSIEKVLNGTSVLSYKGADYGLMTESAHKNQKEIVLLPYQESNDYKYTNIKIAKTLHLQQLMHPPNTTTRAGSLTNEPSSGYIKPVRQQPEGLRMRYRPFGDYSDSSEKSDSESSPQKQSQTHQFILPPLIETPPQVKKRKRDNNRSQDELNNTENPAKPHKKAHIDPKANSNSKSNSKRNPTTTPKSPKLDESIKTSPQTHPKNPEPPSKHHKTQSQPPTPLKPAPSHQITSTPTLQLPQTPPPKTNPPTKPTTPHTNPPKTPSPQSPPSTHTNPISTPRNPPSTNPPPKKTKEKPQTPKKKSNPISTPKQDFLKKKPPIPNKRDIKL